MRRQMTECDVCGTLFDSETGDPQLTLARYNVPANFDACGACFQKFIDAVAAVLAGRADDVLCQTAETWDVSARKQSGARRGGA